MLETFANVWKSLLDAPWVGAAGVAGGAFSLLAAPSGVSEGAGGPRSGARFTFTAATWCVQCRERRRWGAGRAAVARGGAPGGGETPPGSGEQSVVRPYLLWGARRPDLIALRW